MRLNLLFATLLLTLGQATAQVNVTFRVDMTGQTVSADGVHLAGSLNGWNTTANKLDLQGNGVYAVTVPLAPGTDVEYKYLNGNAWGKEEAAPASCTVGGNNRIFTVGSTDMTLDVVPFNGCPASVPTRSVTFKVDMSGQTISTSGIHVAGNFQGWNPGATLMTAAGNGVYSVTVTALASISVLQYKFINGNAWGSEENNIPAACKNGSNNRFYDVTGQSVVDLPIEQFNGCANPAPTKEVVFSVDMAGLTVDAAGVHVAGDFQGWKPEATKLNQVGSSSIYTVSVEVPSVLQTLQYKYVNGDAWGKEEDPPTDCQNADNNRVGNLVAFPASTNLPTYKFGSCAVTSGTPTLFEPRRFELLPNITQDMSTIWVELDDAGEATLRVVDAFGRLVQVNNIEPNGTTFAQQLDVASWTAGLYFVQLETARGVAVRPLVVRK